MADSAPIQFYAKRTSAYSLLLRPGVASESHYLAMPDTETRRKIKLPKNGDSRGLARALEDGLRQEGGVWAQLEGSAGEFTIVTKGYRSGSYEPPARLAVVRRDTTIDYRPISGDRVIVRRDEFVLLPVDRSSEQQLESWLGGIESLSGDLREATLRSIIDGGLLDLRKRQPSAEDSTAPMERPRRIPVGAWIALAAILGLGIGLPAGYFGPPLLHPTVSPKMKATAPPSAVPASMPAAAAARAEAVPEGERLFEENLSNLKGALNISPSEKLKPLVESHSGPLELESTEEFAAARRVAEALIVVKVVMWKTPGTPVKLAWSRESNQQAATFLKERFQSLPPDDKSAIRAVFCYAGEAPPGGGKCTPDDWKTGAAALEGLAQAATSKPPTTPKPPTKGPK